MPVEEWTSEAFLSTAREWVAAHLPEGRLTGEWEQPHARPWSSAIRFEATAGRVWFKVNGPGSHHEAALTLLLGRVVPDLVPEVLAVDSDRGWTLLSDAGPTLRSVLSVDDAWAAWEALLPRYAEAQRVLAAHESEVLAAGVPDQRPGLLPGQLADLVDRLGGLPPDRGGLTAEQAAAFRALEPVYADWCAELDAAGIAPSVNHDDVHSNNVCLPGSLLASARFIDWGDTVWSHPFGTLLGTMNSIAFHAGTEVTDPRVQRVRDAYLEVFPDVGTPADRERWVRLARRTGCVTKAQSYVRAFLGEPESAEASEDWPVRAWLLETLDPAVAG